MGYTSDPAFLVSHTVRLKGMADTGVIADTTGLPVDDVDRIVQALAESDLLLRQEGRILRGWKLTPSGKERHQIDLRLDVEHAGCEDRLVQAYNKFLSLNEQFKEVCTAWQLRQDAGGQLQPNDHADETYDKQVRDRLVDLHEGVAPAIDHLSLAFDRFGRYPIRFNRALERIDCGDRDAFTRPLSDSYHDVWMELHQDLLLTLGRTRSADDGH